MTIVFIEKYIAGLKIRNDENWFCPRSFKVS